MQNRAIRETSLVFTAHKADLWTKGFIFDDYVIDLQSKQLDKSSINFTFQDGKFFASGHDILNATVYKANEKLMDIQISILFQTEWLIINYDREKIYEPMIKHLDVDIADVNFDKKAIDDYKYIKSYLRNIRKDIIDLEIKTSNLKTTHTYGI